MFFNLMIRNSKRNRKENGLFFSSLIVSIVAFYIILSLSHQDVMVFLAQMESDAVNKLMGMIPVFYGFALFILFFLIYYASKFQLERRKHEFGVYLMLGMRRRRLFAMLLAEDFRNSVISLIIGLPSALLLSELISLITARLVGIGIISHKLSFSLSAVLWTSIGFLFIKFTAFLILSGKISRQEIGSLLVEKPDETKKEMPAFIYAASILIGISCLAIAYVGAIQGEAWSGIWQMARTITLGIFGTFSLFWGIRFLIGVVVKSGKQDRPLHVFNFRQIQENVIHRSGTLAICSMLILAALCCFGAGVAISRFYGESEQHALDYTFEDHENENDSAAIRQILEDHQLVSRFSHLFDMKTGYIRTTEDTEHAFQMEPLLAALHDMPPSQDRHVLLYNLKHTTYPHIISLSCYNQLLRAASMPELILGPEEAAIYMDHEFAAYERKKLLDRILQTRPEAQLDGKTIHLTGTVQTTSLVTDRFITLSFALILPDEMFEYYTQGEYNVYLNGILAKDETEDTSLLSAISEMNQKLNKAGLTYESYLQNMGRQLFYMVAASYITMYLAVIFLIISNTVIGVQFLMSQQKSTRRYRTLIRLGATYTTLCNSARKQIHWYFGLPTVIAAFSSLFGVRSLLTGILSSRAKSSLTEMMIISVAIILALCVIEYIYITAVKRSSDRYLLKLMVPEREE